AAITMGILPPQMKQTRPSVALYLRIRAAILHCVAGFQLSPNQSLVLSLIFGVLAGKPSQLSLLVTRSINNPRVLMDPLSNPRGSTFAPTRILVGYCSAVLCRFRWS